MGLVAGILVKLKRLESFFRFLKTKKSISKEVGIDIQRMFEQVFSDYDSQFVLGPRTDKTIRLAEESIGPLYVGVETSATIMEISLTLTQEAIEFLSSTDRHDINTEWVGSKMQKNVLSMITNSSHLLAVLTARVVPGRADLAIKTLKVALYEALTQPFYTNQLGVSHAAPADVMLIKENIPLNEIDTWKY